jgi:putative N6-adenine-specific DNA methylase
MQGLEEVLAAEIQTLGGKNIQIGRRMVSFDGDKRLLYKANIHLRTALRILRPIAVFQAQNPDEVYQEVQKIDWNAFMTSKHTFAIDAVVYSDLFRNSNFLSYRVKDSIADFFTESEGKRPSVRLHNPDIYVHVHVSHETCTIALDSSGESLHKRGYRADQNEAPLNEVLAAGMLLLAGWKGQCDFIDPMCGSGTLLIEAALIALNIPPGIYRKSFAFEKWLDFDSDVFDELLNEDTDETPFAFKIYGSDISPVAIKIAENNVRSASVSKYIELQTKGFQKLESIPKEGLLVTNPPYGERIKPNDLLGLYEQLGERLKHLFLGYSAWILSYREDCFEKIGLRPSEKIRLMNGPLECEFRCYEIFSGKRKEFISNRQHE